MNKVIFFMVSSFVFLMIAGSVFAETAEDVSSDPKHIYPSAEDLDGTKIEIARDRYLSERGWSLGMHDANPSSGYIGWGSASVAVGVEDKNYGNARIAAVDGAIADALGQFALSRGTNAALDRTREILQDPNALEDLRNADPQQFLTAVKNRLRDLTAAKLDSALRELGIPSGKHQQLEFSQKVQLATDSIQTQIVRSAREYFQGIRLLYTFEEQGAIGALVIFSPTLQEIASQILSGNMQAVGSGNSSDALDQLNGSLSDEELMFMHGTRLLRDQDGNPVIISFGQASPAVTKGDNRQVINMAVTAAQRQANARADGALAEFLDSYVEVDDEVLNGVAVETIGELFSDGRERESTGAKFYSKLTSEFRQRSQIQLTGITTVRTWRANHPDTGHLHVGAVKMWSPTTQAAFSRRPKVDTVGAAPEVKSDGAPSVKERSSSPFGKEDW